MAILTLMFLLGGIFTCAGNRFGLEISIGIFVFQIVVIYLPGLTSFSTFLNFAQNVENILIMTLGVLLAMNLTHRLPR